MVLSSFSTRCRGTYEDSASRVGIYPQTVGAVKKFEVRILKSIRDSAGLTKSEQCRHLRYETPQVTYRTWYDPAGVDAIRVLQRRPTEYAL